MIEEKEQPLEQPSDELQKVYASLINDDYTECSILHHKAKYKVYWLRNGQIEKLSRLLLDKQDDDAEDKEENMMEAMRSDAKLACRAAAIYTLHRWWKLKLLYWLRWRWFYYVKEYSFIELKDIIAEGKKKVPQMPFFTVITSLIGAKATLMTMRAKEVEAILRERDTEQRTQQQKSGNG